MARKRFRLAFISKEANRRNTLRKRSKGLVKKADELSKLCGVKGCMVVFGQHERHAEAVWPSREEAEGMVEELKNLPETGRAKKVTTHGEFVAQTSQKLDGQIVRQLTDNKDLVQTAFMYEALSGGGLHGASLEDATSLIWTSEKVIMQVCERMKALMTREAASKKVVRATDDVMMMMMPDMAVVSQKTTSQYTIPMSAATTDITTTLLPCPEAIPIPVPAMTTDPDTILLPCPEAFPIPMPAMTTDPDTTLLPCPEAFPIPMPAMTTDTNTTLLPCAEAFPIPMPAMTRDTNTTLLPYPEAFPIPMPAMTRDTNTTLLPYPEAVPTSDPDYWVGPEQMFYGGPGLGDVSDQLDMGFNLDANSPWMMMDPPPNVPMDYWNGTN